MDFLDYRKGYKFPKVPTYELDVMVYPYTGTSCTSIRDNDGKYVAIFYHDFTELEPVLGLDLSEGRVSEGNEEYNAIHDYLYKMANGFLNSFLASEGFEI